MEIPEIKIALLCLFCGSELQAEEGKDYTSGDMILCRECGETNDHDSLLAVAKEKGMKVMEAEVQKALDKEFKNIFT